MKENIINGGRFTWIMSYPESEAEKENCMCLPYVSLVHVGCQAPGWELSFPRFQRLPLTLANGPVGENSVPAVGTLSLLLWIFGEEGSCLVGTLHCCLTICDFVPCMLGKHVRCQVMQNGGCLTHLFCKQWVHDLLGRHASCPLHYMA